MNHIPFLGGREKKASQPITIDFVCGWIATNIWVEKSEVEWHCAKMVTIKILKIITSRVFQ